MNYRKGFIGLGIIVIVGLVIAAGGGYYLHTKQADRATVSELVATTTATSTLTEDLPAKTTERKETETTSPAKSEGYTQIRHDVGSETTTSVDTQMGTITVHSNFSGDIAETTSCSGPGCFDAKFASCQPATLSASVGPMAVAYEILGPAAGGCQITMEYTKIANPDWEGKKMTCTLDTTARFETVIAQVPAAVMNGSSECEGPLADAMRESL